MILRCRFYPFAFVVESGIAEGSYFVILINSFMRTFLPFVQTSLGTINLRTANPTVFGFIRFLYNRTEIAGSRFIG